eukprot:TRINITY_DN103061_c0_g1_i1.p1 TRINITY_DN103061_c0_g1~~TRINITY_DN103061_c0_g1_i1.p1  ORF type:complete len:633 (-),score=136.55 TRINITY_DN103061_c0_g1_i1:221-2119(-)
MDFFAVTRTGVHVYTFQPGEQDEPPSPSFSFDGVNTADGLEWSADGTLLGLVDPNTGGVSVYNSTAEYAKLCEVPPLVGGPVRSFYFSPLGNHLVTHERWVKDGGNNVGVWNAKTGELRFSFMMKKQTEMSWPPLKWTSLETHCCRMVQDGVQIMPGNCDKESQETRKIDAPGIMAFEVAPKGAGVGGTGSTHVALCIAESKGAPARCQVYKLDDPAKPTATKNFFKAQTVTMKWNNMGSALLIKTSMEVDDTGKSYYGGSNLYFVRADGEEASIVAAAEGGHIHDVQWNPTQDEFVLLHGQLPCPATLHEGKKGSKRMDFGSGHRNTIKWDNFGRFFVLGGYGQLLGDTDFWDKPGKRLMGSNRMECCVVCGWAPDGRHFLTATTAPRMRVDNKVEVYDYVGNLLTKLAFDELLLAGWRPRPRGAFQDRPPSPGRKKEEKSSTAGANAKPKAAGAYRPPGARGGGGLAALLRNELGSTAGTSASTATKVGQAGPVSLPPGAAPMQATPAAGGGGGGASRNARKKKAKEAAQESADKDKVAAATSAPPVFEPPSRGAEDKKPPPVEKPAAAAEGGALADEVEKRVRALRKKLRDIEKLKEKAAAGPLDPLQKQKIEGEADLIRQIRELGAEP